jgi:hypothetical protein
LYLENLILFTSSPQKEEKVLLKCVSIRLNPYQYLKLIVKVQSYLCDKSPFVVDSLFGAGMDRNEIESGNCIFEEFQSSWYKWTCDESGSLTFTLTPNNHRGRNFVSDDLDFAVYELTNGLDDCRQQSRTLIRCMASGANGDGAGNALPLAQWIDCNGPTGLRTGESDFTETAGCARGDNNFVAPLSMETGKSYMLVINNYSRSGLGFEGGIRRDRNIFRSGS